MMMICQIMVQIQDYTLHSSHCIILLSCGLVVNGEIHHLITAKPLHTHPHITAANYNVRLINPIYCDDYNIYIYIFIEEGDCDRIMFR